MQHLPTLSGAFDEMSKNHLMSVNTEPENKASLNGEINRMAIHFLPIINLFYVFLFDNL